MFHMEQYNHKIGRLGEKIANQYFINNGYAIIAKNARISHKEIDLIIQKDKEIRFIEVKTSYFNAKNLQKTKPEDYISDHKIRLLKEAIYEYCLILAKKQENIYLDAISITLLNNKMANISYFKNIT
jgi:putative endonuclease